MFLLHSLKGVATISRGTSQSAKCWRMLIYFCYSASFSGGVVGVYNLEWSIVCGHSVLLRTEIRYICIQKMQSILVREY